MPDLGTSFRNASLDRLRRLPFFSETAYMSLNPDLGRGGIEPAEHALIYACVEGRPMFTPHHLARAWGNAVVSTRQGFETAEAVSDGEDLTSLRTRHPKASVFVGSNSDAEIKRIASCLVDDLRRVGLQASSHDETAELRQDYGLSIIVAPHEFFRLGLGPLWERTEMRQHGFVYNTLPLHVAEFQSALPFILTARGVIDGSPQMAHVLRQASIPALQIQVTAPSSSPWLDPADQEHPLVLALPVAGRTRPSVLLEWDARTIDIAFFGKFSRRRSAFFGRHAGRFSPYSTYIYNYQGGRDVIDETVERRQHSRIAAHLGGHAKLTLHIMEDEFHHFDWLTCVCHAMWSGSVVVSDFCPPHPLFKAGTHLFEDDVRHIPTLVDWLLRDAEGRHTAQVARAKTLALLHDSAFEVSRANSLAAFLQTRLREEP